jgi:muramoyltetrapeptide carboxypeptidase
MKSSSATVQKPRALRKESRITVFAPASPSDLAEYSAGVAELSRLGFTVEPREALASEGYFASPSESRLQEFLRVASDPNSDAMVALRGGYGSNYLITEKLHCNLDRPKCLIGFSDLTSLQIYLWQTSGWVTFYGPMVAAGLRQGSGAPKGYDQASFLQAISNTSGGWTLNLQAENLARGEAQGTVLGGCLTLLQTTLGTPWELDTRDSILLLEDTGMKPYQVDRALMHLLQAGKFAAARGIILGDFPNSAATVPGSPSVREVCKRILEPLKIQVVYGAPVGHTERPMLTLPLGIHAKLTASGEGTLQFLESAVID